MERTTLKETIVGFFNIDRGAARHKKLRKRIEEGAVIDGIHICQLIAAMIIASIGLNVDSTEAVIGAMLICPLMGSVLALAYGFASLDSKMLRDAVTGLIIQMAICLATSTVYFAISPLSHQTSELLSNSTATVWDVLIAFVGGFAGALGVSRRQEPATLIAGVAVATALMPPLCSTGFGLAGRDLVLAASAFYEFLINVVFIAFGAELVFVWIHVPLNRDLDGDGVVSLEEHVEAERRSKQLRTRLIIGSLVFAIPCLFVSAQVVQKAIADHGSAFEVRDTYDAEETTRELKVVCPTLVDYRIGAEDSFDMENEKLNQSVVATVVTSAALNDEQKSEIEQLVKINAQKVDRVDFDVKDPASYKSDTSGDKAKETPANGTAAAQADSTQAAQAGNAQMTPGDSSQAVQENAEKA